MPKPYVKRTPELEEEILHRLSKGEPLDKICMPDDMPTPRTVIKWGETDDDFLSRYREARNDGFDALAYSALELARKPYDKLEDGRIDPSVVSARKLEIWTILELLKKWDPKRYGERVALDHGAQGSLADLLELARSRVVAAGRERRESATS